MSRPQPEITRAIQRLRHEPQLPLSELAGQPLEVNGVLMHPTAQTWMRWGRQGKAGVYLDVLFCRRRLAWVTSREAVARFERDLAAAAALRPGAA